MSMRRAIKKLSLRFPVLNKLARYYRKKRRHVKQNRKLGEESRGKVFSDIYSNKIWGGYDKDFYSGGGSYFEELIIPYCTEIQRFIREKKIRKVIDFGCGDFNVASKFVSDDIEYIGVDIVPELIKRNMDLYASDNISFVCMDIVEKEASNADLCLVREVFQHLSNEEILQALSHIKKYKYVIVTESVVKKELLCGNYNLDKAHGNSFGVYLEEAPFCLKTEIFLRLPYPGVESQEMISALIVNE